MALDCKIPLYLLKTKSSPTDGYEEFFQKTKFDPVFVPVLEHHFNPEALDTIEQLVRTFGFTTPNNAESNPSLKQVYGGLIFTSQRAVEAFSSVVVSLRELGVNVDELLPAGVPLYVVGPATAKSLRSLKLQCPIVGEETGNGEALAHFILSHYNSTAQFSEGAKPPLLFLVGEQRRDIIPKTLQSEDLPDNQRTGVEEMVVYETGVMDSFEADFRRLALPRREAEELQWIVVFSPTGCKAMLKVLGYLDEDGKIHEGWERGRTKVATIGPTTRNHLVDNFKFEPDVCAPRPSPEGILEGIAAFEG